MTVLNDGPGHGSALPNIVVRLSSLPRADRQVAQTILDNPEIAVYATVSQLADLAKVAPSTVIHAAKALGYRGFQELKVAVAKDLGRVDEASSSPDGNNGTSRSNTLFQVLRQSAEAIRSAESTVDPDAFDSAVSLLASAKDVLLLANGGSRAPADDAAYRFHGIGLRTSAPTDIFAQQRYARLLSDADVCLALSYTGATSETLAGVEMAMEQGAHIIAITSHAKSPLTDMATTSLIAGAPEQNFYLEAMTSRLAHLAVIDALYIALGHELGSRARRAMDAGEEVMARHIA